MDTTIKLPMELLIRTDANKDAIERIQNITQPHDVPELLFLVGPEESGKTEIMRSRELEKDLLSTKKTLYRPCRELPEALRANVYDGYLEELGNVDVLFLDDFEGFFEDEELGPEMCKLLLRTRYLQGLDTVVSSRKPLSEYDLSGFGSTFDDFQEITVERLEGEGQLEYIKMLDELYFNEESSPILSEEALRFMAFELNETMELKRRAMHYLHTKYQGEPGEVLSRDFVEAALSKES